MASKKTAAKKPAPTPQPPAPASNPLVTQNINPSAGKTIDERMADLLKDHEAMGAR